MIIYKLAGFFSVMLSIAGDGGHPLTPSKVNFQGCSILEPVNLFIERPTTAEVRYRLENRPHHWAVSFYDGSNQLEMKVFLSRAQWSKLLQKSDGSLGPGDFFNITLSIPKQALNQPLDLSTISEAAQVAQRMGMQMRRQENASPILGEPHSMFNFYSERFTTSFLSALNALQFTLQNHEGIQKRRLAQKVFAEHRENSPMIWTYMTSADIRGLPLTLQSLLRIAYMRSLRPPLP